MKRIMSGAAALFLILFLPLSAQAAHLVPVGALVGIRVRSEAVTVAAFDDLLGGGAREAGVKIGDRLLEVGGVRIREASEVADALGDGDSVLLTLIRGSKKYQIEVPLRQTEQGPRLGLYLRQGVSGIGTVTWYDPATGTFGALGHGVSGGDGTVVPLWDGEIFDAELMDLRRGTPGSPGQLRGEASEELCRGTLFSNAPQGVFGKATRPWEGEAIETAAYEEISLGEATILTTVSGDAPREYEIEILKVYPRDRADGRDLLIRITDPDLLWTTGGIIQGMSGSPIIQDGKLVGAVTHVLVNDPTTGYGIFIENMLEAAS